jgi:ADP-ribosyl-[dinitrogen reductase] hydrolase
MLGSVIGDIVGSVYEFDNYKYKNFSPFFHQDAFFTDDTICTIAVADSLLNNIEPSQSLRHWCRKYWHIGGWGLRYQKWVLDESMGPYNSCGNGSAMRVSPAGYLAKSIDHAIELSNRVTEVTHNHPEGLKGAAATAVAIYIAKSTQNAENVRTAIVERFGYDLSRCVDQIRKTYEYNELAQTTVPEALICALDANNYEDAIRNAISIGGDSDTIAAIAGGVAEALFGIDESIREKGLSYLPEDMKQVLHAFYS